MAVRLILALVAAVLISSCGHQDRPKPILTVRIQPSLSICLGKCPDLELSVVNDRRIEIREFNLGRGPQIVHALDLPSATVAAFRREFAAIRPDGTVKRGVPCPLPREYERERYGPDNYDIQWNDPGRSSHLMACVGDQDVASAIDKSFLDLSLAPMSVYRLNPVQLAHDRRCLAQEGTPFC